MFNEITLRNTGNGIEVSADGKRLVTIHDQAALIRVFKALMTQSQPTSFFGLW